MRHITIITGVLLIASVARGGAFVELVPDNPGPYFGGETLNVDVLIHNAESLSYSLRFVQWEFSASDPAIALVGDFHWDFSTVPFGGVAYFSIESYPRPSTAYLAEVNPDLFLVLPADGVLRSGSTTLALPSAPGSYLLDVLNNVDMDGLAGAILESAGVLGEPVKRWRSDGTGDDLITGGALNFHVVPEIQTATFLLLGLLLILCVPKLRGSAIKVSILALLALPMGGWQLPPAAQDVVSQFPGVGVYSHSLTARPAAFYGRPMTIGATPAEAAQKWLDDHADAFGIANLDLQLLRNNAIGDGSRTVFADKQIIAVNPWRARWNVFSGDFGCDHRCSRSARWAWHFVIE